MVYSLSADFSVQGLEQEIDTALTEGSLTELFDVYEWHDMRGIHTLTTHESTAAAFQAYQQAEAVIKRMNASASQRLFGNYMKQRQG